MLSTKEKAGFTLIELLVVIAIIGLLAAVISVTLGSARGRGKDSAIRSNLLSTRSHAELYFYNNNNSYIRDASNNICRTGVAADGVTRTAYTNIQAAAKAAGLSTFSVNAVGSLTTATCNVTASGWAVEIPLNGGGMFCVDSSYSGTTTASTLTSIAPTIDTKCN